MQTQSSARRVSFSEALRFWIKLGFISFGGPAGQIAIMHRELVEKRRWLGEERFLHALNYCMLLPGPEAQQLAIYIGWLMHRTWGGIAAGAFFVIPSIFILLGLSYIYAAYGSVPVIAGILDGFKPVVVAIVVEAVVKIGRRALKRGIHLVIAALAFVAIYLLHVPFPLIVLTAALIGLAGAIYFPASFSPPPENKTESKDSNIEELPRLVITDEGVPPAHTLPDHVRFAKTLAIGTLLWLLPFVLLIAWQGSNSLQIQEYRFFTQSALVTFGGAYAVLAYVTQAITAAPYNWITPAQAVDGLALAETTPGPLIMVLQFVGFMAGWNYPPDGMTQLSSAVLGALVATYATFLPCFLFIFLGAPYIEYLRGNKLLTGALSGVTSAVVGVILNLAVVFGAAVIFSGGFIGNFNLFAAILFAISLAALFYFRIGVIWVVLGGGLIGLLRNAF
ncbi:MAG: chromate efflux transporter [Acidobacteriota bacterium]|nr:chromate efflux transporter [Acidobacteriota bacterium]